MADFEAELQVVKNIGNGADHCLVCTYGLESHLRLLVGKSKVSCDKLVE